MFRILRPVALALAIAGFSSAALAQTSPVVGSWDTVADTPMGKFEATMVFTQEGEAYKLDILDKVPDGSPPMEDVISDLVVNANAFSFKRSLSTPGGPIDLSYKGIVEGDALTADSESSFGTVKVTGTRAATK